MTFKQFNRIVEIRTKIISMGTFACASSYAVVNTHQWSWPRFLVTLASVLCIDMGTTGFNSFFDFASGTDIKEYNLEKDKVLVHEGVNPLAALGISLALYAIGGALGLLLAYWTSWKLLLAGAVSMAIGFLYTGGPFPISRTPFGELFAGGFLGSILFLIAVYVQKLTLNASDVLVSLPFSLLIGLILTVNNTCDKKADIIAGRRTLSILLSQKTIIKIMKATLILSWGLSILTAALGLLPLLSLPLFAVSFLLSAKTYHRMQRRGFSLSTKGISMGDISRIFLLYCLSFVLGNLFALLW